MHTIEPEVLAGHLTDRSTRGIARDTARLVRTGVLPVGARLPSLRVLAYVSEADPKLVE